MFPRRVLLVAPRLSSPRDLDRLHAHGFSVDLAESLADARHRLRRGDRYDAVLVPTLDEVDLPTLDELEEHGARVVLVVREGEASPEDRLLLEAEAFPFVFEPIDPEQLEEELGRPSRANRPSLTV